MRRYHKIIALLFLGWLCFPQLFCFGKGLILKDLLISPQEIEQGKDVQITLKVVPTEALEKDYFLFCHLEGPSFVNADINPTIPTSLWVRNKIITLGPFFVHIPYGLKPGGYRVKLGLAREIKKAGRISYEKISWQGKGDFYLGRLFVSPAKKFSINQRQVGFLTNVYKTFREKELFDVSRLQQQQEIYLAKNEYECLELVVVPGKKDVAVTFQINDLKDEKGHVITKENITIYRMDYVQTKEPYYNTKKVGSWPDPLREIEGEKPNYVRSKFLQPFLLEIYVPPQTPAGFYQGTISINDLEVDISNLLLKVNVFNFTLNKERHLRTGFDVYEYLFYNHLSKNKYEHQRLYQMHMRKIIDDFYVEMIRHRMDPVRNVGVPKLLSMGKEEVALDFSEFEERFQFFLNRGQQSFGIGDEWPWWRKEAWPQDKWYAFRSPEALTSTFQKIGTFLERKGWLDYCYTYILDETYKRVDEIYGLIHKGHPKMKNLLPHTPRLKLEDVDIWCVRINNFLRPQVEAARKAGKEIWMYVAGATRPFPNLLIDVPSLEARIIPWVCFKYDIEGFLYWCANWWPHDPWDNPMVFGRQNGNGSLYYPGQEVKRIIPSLRVKLFREGMEDYEYLFMLKQKYERVKAKVPSSIRKEVENILALDMVIKELAHTTTDIGVLEDLKRRIGVMITNLTQYE